MTVRVGCVGIGFMGKCHFENYATTPGAKVVAICDIDPKKRSGDWSSIAGNIGGAGKKMNLSKYSVYDKAEKLFADPNVDVVDITLPTYLHAQYAIKAMKAGKHVICEKPIARTSAQAEKMIDTAKKTKRRLFIGQCIRFWPEYAAAREIIQSKKYGKVISANFTRVSPQPVWGWQNWLQDQKKSGLAALDLHIHDADFILHTFGKPKAVTCKGAGQKPGRLDHVMVSYDYGKNQLVTAEGGWALAPDFPFSMSFHIAMEKASLVFPSGPGLMLCPFKGKARAVKCTSGDGYSNELKEFISCIRTGKASKIVTPVDALRSVKLIEASVKSAKTGKAVKVVL